MLVLENNHTTPLLICFHITTCPVVSYSIMNAWSKLNLQQQGELYALLNHTLLYSGLFFYFVF